jgi:uncharacterized membrane protein (DUF4010 family)
MRFDRRMRCCVYRIRLAKMDLTITSRLAIALILGLIVGMERGWENRESPKGFRVAGIRSFGFVGLFGGISAILAGPSDRSILAMAFVGLAAIVLASYSLTARETQHFGITTELSLMVVFVLGALAGQGYEREAIAASVICAMLLGFKQELHKSLEYLDRRELIATLQLLLIAAVVLPILPDRNLGLWNALNPRAIGLLVSLIAGISYTGYFAMRWLGARAGLLATAVLGGVVSSTAVTVAFGRIAGRKAGSVALLGAGISLASGTMALRLLAEVSIVNAALLPILVMPLAVLAIVPFATAGAIALRYSTTDTQADIPLHNPIELWTALGYGLVFSALLVSIRAVEAEFGQAGVYVLAALSGLADVHAVSLSLAQATLVNLPVSVGATGIVLAAMVNTAMKALLAVWLGGKALAQWCSIGLLVALCVSAMLC